MASRAGVGQVLGHYRIVAPLGAGGMGEVYCARDLQLERDVALKLLPLSAVADATAKARLLREARTASQLSHPNICTIHEVGECDGRAFIAMELVAGEALSDKLRSGPLDTGLALRYGLQMADAVAYAHVQGVVHRDLKSANVMVTPEGRVKVLDFGLAKRLREDAADAITQSASLTQPGTVVGTLAYMAPEQLRGEVADARSDVWALGVVLYQMATGVLPFQGQTGFTLSAAILNQPPAPIQGTVPVQLRATIERCLEKEPSRRYQSGGELRAALEAVQTGVVSSWTTVRYRLSRRRWLAGGVLALLLIATAASFNLGRLRAAWGGVPRIESLAVLPLEDQSGGPQEEWFADGMTESLITDLGRLTGLKRVIARGSVIRYKSSKQPLAEIARELGVDLLLTGAVLRSGNRVRITAHLIQPDTGEQLWSQPYEGDLSDVLRLQNQVTKAIATQIRLKLAPAEKARLASARRIDPEAQDAYLKGEFLRQKAGPKNLETALRYFDLALQKDPNYVPAYISLANSWLYISRGGALYHVLPSEGLPKAKAAAMKALELDDQLAGGHLALANVLWAEWDWEGANREFQRAYELGPNDPDVCSANLRRELFQGHQPLSEAEVDRCVALDPLSASQQVFRAWYLRNTGRTDEAIAQLDKALRLDPEYIAVRYQLFLAYREKGRYNEALAERKTHARLSGDPEMVAVLERGARQGGFRGAMLAMAQTLEQRSEKQFFRKMSIAEPYLYAGEKDRALDWLERAFEERTPTLMDLKTDVKWAELRSEQRFQALLRRINLPQ